MNNESVLNTIEIVKKKLKKYTDLQEHEKVKLFIFLFFFLNLIFLFR